MVDAENYSVVSTLCELIAVFSITGANIYIGSPFALQGPCTFIYDPVEEQILNHCHPIVPPGLG